MGNLSVWYDEEGDYLELTREGTEGFFVDLGSAVFERVDEDGGDHRIRSPQRLFAEGL